MMYAMGSRGMVFAAQDEHVERRVHKQVRISGNGGPVEGGPYALPCLDMEQVSRGNAKEGPVDGFLGGLFYDPVVGFEAGACTTAEEAVGRRPMAQLFVGPAVQGRLGARWMVWISHNVVVCLGLGMVGRMLCRRMLCRRMLSTMFRNNVFPIGGGNRIGRMTDTHICFAYPPVRLLETVSILYLIYLLFYIIK